MALTPDCPCGSGHTYQTCCEPYLSGNAWPDTPEALMRSRYTAYTQANVEYIQRTMKPPASDHFDPQDARQWAQQVHWDGLSVIQSTQDEDSGQVEFIARFTEQHTAHHMHELSLFRRDQGQWYYIDGRQPAKAGRNDPCPCGSGKKFKKCCGA